MPGRGLPSSTGYRYGFNGKEDDQETVGTGNGTQDYGMRIYNPSLGKFLSVDPITAKYPELTPYQFASNRPIDGIDMDGLEYLDAKNPNIESVKENTDFTYEVKLDEKHTIHNVTKENINGSDYFNLRQDMYYGKKGWSNNRWGGKLKITQTLNPSPEERNYSVNEFISKAWPKMTGKEMTDKQKVRLEDGCVGITSCIIGMPGTTFTILNGGYNTLGQAQDAKKKAELTNPTAKFVIFSVRFYSADPVKFRPDRSGKINMLGWDFNESRPGGGFNFDYGYLNEPTGMWWHANQANIPKGSMIIKQGTLFDFSRPDPNFNRQIFVVAPIGF
jgi:RHS repeat-associated protein